MECFKPCFARPSIPITGILFGTDSNASTKPQGIYLLTERNSVRAVMPMLIGIMADTYDNLPMVERAIRRLNEAKVELALHTGDYVSPFVIPLFKELKAKLIGVFGNNDGDHELLKKRFSENERLEIRGNFRNSIWRAENCSATW